MEGSRFLDCEDDFVRQHYGHTNVAWMAVKLGKSETGVHIRGNQLGLVSNLPRGKNIDRKEVDRLLEEGLTHLQVAAELKATEQAIKRIDSEQTRKAERKKRDERNSYKAEALIPSTPPNRISLLVFRKCDADWVDTHPGGSFKKSEVGAVSAYRASNKYLRM